jgi:hypothetical protein
MSEKPETSSFWCENSLVDVKPNFHVNLTCFHTKSSCFHTKVCCELNPCFFLMWCRTPSPSCRWSHTCALSYLVARRSAVKSVRVHADGDDEKPRKTPHKVPGCSTAKFQTRISKNNSNSRLETAIQKSSRNFCSKKIATSIPSN